MRHDTSKRRGLLSLVLALVLLTTSIPGQVFAAAAQELSGGETNAAAPEPLTEEPQRLTLDYDGSDLRPNDRKLNDFTVTAVLSAQAEEETETAFRLEIALPEQLSFPEGPYALGGTDGRDYQILADGEVLAEIAPLPEGAELTAAACENSTLTVDLTQRAGGAVTVPAEGFVYPLTVHGALLEMADGFRTGTITVNGQLSGGPAAAPVTIAIDEEMAEVPAGIEVTERTDLGPQAIYWVDNHDEADSRPDPASFPPPELRFSTDGGRTWERLTPSNMAGLGLDRMPSPTVREDGSGVFSLIYEDLPAEIAVYDTDVDPAEELDRHTVTWALGGQPELDGYGEVTVTEENAADYPSAGDRRGWFYLLESEVSFDIQVRWGTLGGADGLRDLVMNGFSLYVSTDRDADAANKTLQELLEDGVLEIDDSASPDPENPTRGTVRVSGCRKYNLDGTAITYCVDRTGDRDADRLELAGVLEDGDYFQVQYDNSTAPNVGSVLTEAYSGGTIYLTLTGRTGYSASKVWLDQAGSVRPSGEFQLWRYREGASYTTAAPVTDGEGDPYVLALSGESPQSIVFTDPDGSPAQLDKYDPEGYRYLYVVREYLDATAADGRPADSYEQVLGTVNADGSVTDDRPDREAGDRYVYDGGTLSNRLSDTVTAVVEKTWNASAFQSQLEDVTVVFTLQARPAAAEGETPAAWTDTDITVSKTGFTEEDLQFWSAARTAPAYDALGRVLEYRWAESAVYQGTSGENLLHGDGQGFTLFQDGREVTYRIETETGENGRTRVTNVLSDALDYEVVKEWTGGVQPPADGAPLTFQLYQIPSGGALDGSAVPYLTFTWDGETVEIVAGPEGAGIAAGTSSQGTGADGGPIWSTWLHGLPEFDGDGQEYEYLLLENTAGTDYFPTYQTQRDPETGDYRTVVTNGPGGGNRILVRKVWIDGSDSAHRGDATISVYEKGTDALIDSVTLTGGVWSAQVGIGDRDPADVYILETEVQPSQGEQAEAYRVPLRPYQLSEGGTAEYEVPAEPAYDGSVYQYETRFHRYEATYQASFPLAGETIFPVTNRRLGSVDLTVTKTWEDGDGTLRQALAEAIAALTPEDRITPYIQLRFAEGTEEDGTHYITKGGHAAHGEGDLPADAVRLGGAETLIRDDEGRPTTARQAIALDPEQDRQRFCYFGLPKYDENGAVVRYTVEEVWLTDGAKEEVPSLTGYLEAHLPDSWEKKAELLELLREFHSAVGTGTYEVAPENAILQDDVQTIPVTNSLGDTKTICWYKDWKDNYTLENDQRPDIYLDVYQVTHDQAGQPEVSLYRQDYRWHYATGDGESSWNHWRAEITGAPKYDDAGYEILYFAVEHSSVNTADFDYQPAAYAVPAGPSGELLSIGTVSDVDQAYLQQGYAVAVPDASGEYALVEGGTFTNRLASAVEIRGQKLWTGLPGGYPAVDLPAVTFAVDRTWTENGEPRREEDVASLTVSQWASLYQNGTYVFQILYEGVNTMRITDGTVTVTGEEGASRLPRYDAYGNLYTYALREREVLDWSQAVDDANGETRVSTEDVFTIIQPASNSYVAANAYHGSGGTLRVKKLLQLDPDEDGGPLAYPAVQLQVSRTYTRNDGTVSQPEVVATRTWTSAEVRSAYEAALAEDPDGAVSALTRIFTFEDLERYAPNGSRYTYTVTELKDGFLEGYVTSAGAGDLDAADAGYDAADAVTGLFPTEPEEGEAPVSATFRNVPDGRTVTLTGEKKWDDYGDLFGLRPEIENGSVEGVTLRLSRSAASQPGQNNAIGWTEVPADRYTVFWSAADGDTWTYTVTGASGTGELEAYAPNGMPWRYRIREVLDSGLGAIYTPSPATVSERTGFDGTFTEMNDLTNRLGTDVPYEKQWKDPAGNAVTGDYIGMVLTVSFEVQVRVNGTGDWMTADEAVDYLRANLGGRFDEVFDAEAFAPQLSGRIGQEGAWRGTVENLPRAIRLSSGETAALSYRVVETRVTGNGASQTIRISQEGGYTVEEAGFVDRADFTPAGNVTANVLDVQSLTVTKTWAGDSGNAYQTRPAADSANEDWQTAFVIQRQAEEAADLWENAQVYGDSYPGGSRDLVVIVSGKNGEDTAGTTISGLPSGVYRARELQPDWQRSEDGTIDPAYILEADGAYFHGAYDADYTDAVSVTNTLRTRTVQVEAQKAWIPEGQVPAGAAVTLVLQYRDRDNRWTDLKAVTLDGTPDGPAAGPACEDRAWHAVWAGLPLYHPDGRNEANGSPAPTDYRVVERPGADFVLIGQEGSADEGYTFRNVPSTSLDVVKTWYGTDASNQIEVVAGLYRTTGTPGDAASEAVPDAGTQAQRKLTLNAGNGWMGTFTGLPACDGTGRAYTYYARELTVNGVPLAESGFDAAYQDQDGTTHIVNYGGDGQEDFVRVTGTKTWVDRDETARDQLQLYLYRTTTPADETSWEPVPETEAILRWWGTDTDQWRYAFENLPRYDGAGTPYTYRVTEESPAGYDGLAVPGVSLLDSGLFVCDFTNVQRGGLTVEKRVTGIGDPEKEFAFTVKLAGSSTAGIPAVDIDGLYGGMTFENGAATFTLKHGQSITAADLPAGLTYTVTEAREDGYETTSVNETGSIPAGGTVTAAFHNHRDDPGGGTTYTHVTVRKVWRLDDGGTAADSVTVDLLRGNTVADTVVLDADNDWTYTWTGLNDRYVWTVEEADVPEGFTAAITRNGMTFTITNDDTGGSEEPDPEEPDPDTPDPGDPEDPDQPDGPDTPDTPDGPDGPDGPEGPDDPEGPGNPDVPRTGDPSRNGLLALLCLTSLVGMALLAALEWKSRRKQRQS